MTLQEIQYKAQAIMQKWRDEDSAPYVEFVEELALMDVPELPDGLEEAEENHIREVIDAAGHPGWDWEARDVRDAFIAGAEWQKKRDDLETADLLTIAHLQGMEQQKAKMMEEAVDGRYMKADGKVYVESWLLDIDPDSVKAGDEVRLIVIPE